jgi:hypothetical protein
MIVGLECPGCKTRLSPICDNLTIHRKRLFKEFDELHIGYYYCPVCNVYLVTDKVRKVKPHEVPKLRKRAGFLS